MSEDDHLFSVISTCKITRCEAGQLSDIFLLAISEALDADVDVRTVTHRITIECTVESTKKFLKVRRIKIC